MPKSCFFFLRLRGMGMGEGLHSEFVNHLKKKEEAAIEKCWRKTSASCGICSETKTLFHIKKQLIGDTASEFNEGEKKQQIGNHQFT